jgi:hypothetical protein
MLRHKLRLANTFLAASSCLFAQTPAPGAGGGPAGQIPPVGDNAVFYMFLRYQNSLVLDIQSATAANAASGQSLQQGAAQSLGLSVTDFSKVNPIYLALAVTLQAVDTDANAYRDSVVSTKTVPDLPTIKQFSSRRDQAVNNARTQLQQALTTAGWQALTNYVEGKFRQSIVRKAVGQ